MKDILRWLYPDRCAFCGEAVAPEDNHLCARCRSGVLPIGRNRCFVCGKPVEEGRELCADCADHPHVFDEGRGIFVYDAKMRSSILRYKESGHRRNARAYAEAMAENAGTELARWRPDALIPVPVHASRRKSRGFNQAECIAEELSALTGIPCINWLVEKVRPTASQKTLSAAARRQNLKQSLRVRQRLRGGSFVVIDDVYTTGSTIDAMAACLKEAGAQRVYFLTVCIGKQDR
ncbi:MAG: ComF family protein [Blautia sp.]|nr:ComF family protein [Blautia sp.]